jgi:polyhydroxyalkanoate synthesis regulator phasin
MFETIEKLMYMGAGAFSMTRKKAEELAETMIEQGRVNAEKSSEFVDSMMNWAGRERLALEEYVQKSVKKALNSAGLVTKCQYDELVSRLEKLEKSAQNPDTQDKGTSKAGPEKSDSPKKKAPSKK